MKTVTDEVVLSVLPLKDRRFYSAVAELRDRLGLDDAIRLTGQIALAVAMRHGIIKDGRGELEMEWVALEFEYCEYRLARVVRGNGQAAA